MNYITPDLFGGEPRVSPQMLYPKFYVKLHQASWLHFDLRLQRAAKTQKGDLFSFALAHTNETHPFFNAKATKVKDHSCSDARREGTLLMMEGEGSVIHWDEGYYAISEAANYSKIINKLNNDIRTGRVEILFDGRKLKGRYQLINSGGEKWQMEKIPDEYDWLNHYLYHDKSIISGLEIDHYHKNFLEQKKHIHTLNDSEALKFSKQNEGVSFKYKNFQLEDRTHKILPI